MKRLDMLLKEKSTVSIFHKTFCNFVTYSSSTIVKGISDLVVHDMEVTVTGPQGFSKKGHVDGNDKINIYVSNPGIYKLEVTHLKFHFEPVIVLIMSDSQVELYPNKK